MIIIFDLLVCALFALPGVSAWVIGVLNDINKLLLLGGEISISPSAYFFVNFAGLLGVAFNVVMLRSQSAGPHYINVIARSGVVTLIIYHMFDSGLPLIFGVFIVTEIVGGLATLYWLRQQTHAG
jgi:hypothetical protein